MEYIIKNINDYSNKEINNFYEKLYDFKKNRISKYKYSNSKTISIIGDILLYDLLIKHNINYDRLIFHINENGKPYIKDNIIYFNISHSFDYIVTVISKKEIGIDIEKIRKTPINTINQFATQKEKNYILSSTNNIEERLFQIYTLKEAYFKMKGTNLNNILNVEFIIDNDKVYCSDTNVKMGFIKDIKGYIVSYCEKL